MLAEEHNLTVCPICHLSETALEFPEARGLARTYPLVRCRHCGLVFQERVGAHAETAVAASPINAGSQNRFGAALEMLIRLFRLSRVRLATGLMPEGGRTLDIGCGRALYLRMLKERGYQVRGTELAAAEPNADPEVPIDMGEVRPGLYPDGSFDLISIWHVLEHLAAPDLTLEACARALKPGGALLIAVPNYGSTQARFGGEHWFHLDLPRHIFHFTQGTLERLLTHHGFRIERCRTGQWEMDPFGLLQTTLNRMGLRHNALFDTLRNDEEIKRDLSGFYRVAMLAAFPIGMLLAVPVSLFLRLMKRAGTLVVLARTCGPIRT
jgi:SAM-dependent methyltransferase